MQTRALIAVALSVRSSSRFSECTSHLVLVTALGDELVADLDPGLQQVLVELGAVCFQQFGDVLALL